MGNEQSKNTVFIGQKPVTAYVMACVTQFSTVEPGEKIVLKARGRAISRCVDVSEVLTRRFLEGTAEVVDIQISTENLEGRDGRKTNVSAIEITLQKKATQ
jgi:DNA-binding protein